MRYPYKREPLSEDELNRHTMPVKRAHVLMVTVIFLHPFIVKSSRCYLQIRFWGGWIFEKEDNFLEVIGRKISTMRQDFIQQSLSAILAKTYLYTLWSFLFDIQVRFPYILSNLKRVIIIAR